MALCRSGLPHHPAGNALRYLKSTHAHRHHIALPCGAYQFAEADFTLRSEHFDLPQLGDNLFWLVMFDWHDLLLQNNVQLVKSSHIGWTNYVGPGQVDRL